ncbi:sensor histidine kinase [Phytomonospora endophytica]|uniref:histidine kinase n=1 Tax=Phytomonospora endophytica TaxID=714109 RepID=A0A841G1U7_9ACTN|nr:ATP-binding protein [Phytomonospora endophytica]MBB6038130.1 signal transduction histidine kinase [Phytomonospora endophytica]GIG67407.1 two-component sensor histidine kinase [Phytomonospora endophytica]
MKLPVLTLRARLTLVYGVLLLAAGTVMLAATYLLMNQQPPSEVALRGATGDAPPPGVEPGLLSSIARMTQHEAQATMLRQGAIALAVVAAASIALGWLIAGRMLQPLHRITDTARRIADPHTGERGLHERIALQGPADEIRELADTFDVMLARLDHSFDAQRTFIANASHELRTPLTLNRALLEVAVNRRAATPEIRQLGDTLLEINARHEKLIDGLLLLAKSERDIGERSYVDLADIVEHVSAWVDHGDVVVEAKAEEAPVEGNPVLLERLVQNLVENAVRHNLPGGWVRVTSGRTDEGRVETRVANTGPRIAPYDIPTLFEPFRRLAAERSAGGVAGAGLGLSIVRAIAHGHGGDVRAEPRDDGGLIVTVSLPGAE